VYKPSIKNLIIMADITGENLIVDGWFMEKNQQWPGQAFSLQVEKIIASKKSKFQDILLFKSKTYGNVLVLDGVIQATEFDEYCYQEMLAFLPLNCHPNPQKVLVIGGGDGGIARECCKHPFVKSVTQCEIDEDVINLCKEHIPSMAKGFSHPKMNLHVGDGFAFMEKHKNEFDVIISDTSDPVGPAERLFSQEYYNLMHATLKDDGILAVQGESMFIHLKLIRGLLDFCNSLYAKAAYATGYVPSYPCGQIGYLLASKNQNTNFQEPTITFTEEEKEKMELKYYDEEIHKTSFILPRNVKKTLGISK